MNFFLAKSLFLIALFILTCSPKEEAPPPPDPPAATGNGDDDKADTEWVLNCTLPVCEGESCCNQENSNCDDGCTGSDYLSLSGDLGNKCLALSKDTVANLVSIFTEVLQKPTLESLNNLDEVDIGLICGTVKEWGSNLLKTRVDNYSKEQAEWALSWIIETLPTIEIFENTKNKDGREMIKTLFQKATQTGGDQGILNGLEMNVGDSLNNTLLTANTNKNKSFIQYIHQEIITSDDGLCSEKNHPTPSSHSPDRQKANDFRKQACVLAVYCKIAPPVNNTQNSDFRKDIARMTNNNNMINFIKTPASEGGLTGSGHQAIPANDVERWTDKACSNLQHFWDNGQIQLGL